MHIEVSLKMKKNSKNVNQKCIFLYIYILYIIYGYEDTRVSDIFLLYILMNK